MSSSYSYTNSYSVVDVRKVMDDIHADLRMIAQDTKLWTQARADSTMGDIIKYAEKGYLEAIQIRLVDANGKNAKVWKYDISEDASGWQSVRPGGNLSDTGAVSMRVTLWMTKTWEELGASAQNAFEATLSGGWSESTDDLSVAHLMLADERRYASNAYGVKRSVYQ